MWVTIPINLHYTRYCSSPGKHLKVIGHYQLSQSPWRPKSLGLSHLFRWGYWVGWEARPTTDPLFEDPEGTSARIHGTSLPLHWPPRFLILYAAPLNNERWRGKFIQSKGEDEKKTMSVRSPSSLQDAGEPRENRVAMVNFEKEWNAHASQNLLLWNIKSPAHYFTRFLFNSTSLGICKDGILWSNFLLANSWCAWNFVVRLHVLLDDSYNIVIFSELSINWLSLSFNSVLDNGRKFHKSHGIIKLSQ